MKFKSMVCRNGKESRSLVIEMIIDREDNLQQIHADLDALLQKHPSKESRVAEERAAA